MIQSVSDQVIAIEPRSQGLENGAGPYAPGGDAFQPRILVGDDDRSNRALLSAALRKRGFRVLQAADGEEALELYGLHQNAIDLVLLDVNMSALDGPEAFKVLRDFDPLVACCFMSDGFGEYKMEDLEALTTLPFFQKPLRVIEMVETLWEVVRDLSPSEIEKHRR